MIIRQMNQEESKRYEIYDTITKSCEHLIRLDGYHGDMNIWNGYHTSRDMHALMVAFGTPIEKLDALEAIVGKKGAVLDELMKLKPLAGVRFMEIGGFQSKYLTCPDSLALEYPSPKYEKDINKITRKRSGPNMAFLMNDVQQGTKESVGGCSYFYTALKEDANVLFWDEVSKEWKLYYDFDEDKRFKRAIVDHDKQIPNLKADERFDMIISRMYCGKAESIRFAGNDYLKKDGFEIHIHFDAPDCHIYRPIGMTHLAIPKDHRELVIFRR